MEIHILGYIATSTSILAFSSQVYHTVKSKTTVGLSLARTCFDVFSLGLWVYYAARVNDNPLLLATAFEFFLSALVLLIQWKLRSKCPITIASYTPPPSPPSSESGSTRIEVKIDRRNSV